MGFRKRPEESAGSRSPAGAGDDPEGLIGASEGIDENQPSGQELRQSEDAPADCRAAEPKTHCGLCGTAAEAAPNDFDCPYFK